MLYVPLGHEVHALDFASEYEPAAQAAQAVSPLVAAIEPAVQGVHDDDPADAENVPAGHCKQAAAEVAPRYWLYVPAEHKVHDVRPR